MRKFQIAVIGYNENRCTKNARNVAFQVGQEIANSGSVLICGGLGGVMEAACKGAKENNGFTLGIIPQDDFSYANEYCDIVICSGIGLARNFIVASSADGIIVIGGGVGTLNEVSVGYMRKKRIVVLKGSGGIADEYAGKYLDERKRIRILSARTPKEAVKKITK
ncbi:MAG: TIGR00725 family protein [Nitrososphaeraceae archaeon]